MTTAVAIAVALLAVPVVSAPTPAQAVGQTYFPVSGAGSTWSANAIQQWVRNVFDNYKWKVTFDDSGSSAGRQLFGQGTVDFAVSEIPYALSGSDSADPRPKRQFAYMPIVAGGTSFMYNLVIGGKRVTNLRLSGDSVAKIFTGVITKWNDPAIVADNPKLALPGTPIVPVVRSDGSGTTAQFTSWMRSQYPSIWSAYCAKAGRSNCGITSNYPTVAGSSFVAQSGSNGVAGYTAQTQSAGAITYVEYSYARNSGFPVAKVLNSAGYYTEPTASNVAVSLLSAVINEDSLSPDYLTSQLKSVYTSPDPRTYPLSSYSYMIIPTALENGFTEDKGLTLADFASYFLCEGQQQAEVLGYSPLPINLAQAGLKQIQKIPGGNPKNKDTSGCNNPTFSADGTNKLAATAPQPQACDKKGADQCLTGTGGSKGSTAASAGTGTGTSGTKPAAATAAAASAAGGVAATTSDGTSIDKNGSAVIDLTSSASRIVSCAPIELPQQRLGLPAVVLMSGAALILLLFMLLPPFIGRHRAAIAGAPRGPTRRIRARRPAKAIVHLPARFTSRGRADASPSDS
ncbi:MAG: phosphate ABC transporter substrate-binding protein PstS [Candidatus Saccharibacteria bacterium]|nr:phosphate ABC transporter substrate-binding protein PstS [Microbacteriaceae bacterium]